jgi:hypothetical protein
MKNVNQLFRLMTEVVFILVGWLLLWVGMTGRYLFDPRRPDWLLVSGVLVLWGLGTWWRGRKATVRVWRAAATIAGASLVLAGLLMMSLAWAPFRWVGYLLAAAGGVFVLRGLLTAALVLRPS